MNLFEFNAISFIKKTDVIHIIENVMGTTLILLYLLLLSINRTLHYRT